MKIGIPREIHPDERRVAATPRTVRELQKLGFEVLIEHNAGLSAEFADELYAEVDATIVPTREELWAQSDIVLKVRGPMVDPKTGQHEADLIKEGGVLIGFLWPAQNKDALDRLASRNVTALSMDCVPRISRAQKMDALSAMANASGYRAMIEAAQVYPRLFAGQFTAAGRVAPAKVLVIGGGVAGLAAIGVARGMGAVVRAFDTRPEVADQVRSMGAEFLELDFEEEADGGGGYAKQMSDAYIEAELELFAQQAKEVDIIITTALIPGKPAPKLITRDMVESMREGAVIVDLAAQQGGNCELTVPGELVTHHGIRIVGYTDLPSRMAIQTSWLYGMTLVHLLEEITHDGQVVIDLDNEITRGALVVHQGETTWPPPKPAPPPLPRTESPERELPPPEQPTPPTQAVHHSSNRWLSIVGLVLAVLAVVGLGWSAPESFLSHFTVFVLACFVGWQLVWNVTPALHTPLMSVTNAISGIIVIGGLLQISGPALSPRTILSVLAVFVATINIAGGFLVTRRMLAMFTPNH
ncbi:MAG TPA: Re/Si-specific NAD(P)(+) transhydrogenase subunit alpha [Phycisphaerales bacterium]|nr:Re/Si-specific NAD(P)(+) transhydrogenase subunit alpha [Phycisphaerales bacterium]